MKLNFILLLGVIIGLVFLMFYGDSKELDDQIMLKPWHMQRQEQNDSLSDYYLENYQIHGKGRLVEMLSSTTPKKVIILVNAWGVPYIPKNLNEEFAVFSGLSVKKIIQRRLGNTTTHAEKAELRKKDSTGVFLFGGDSLEYNRKEYIPQLGYDKLVFCQNCSDSVMLGKLDSILNENAEIQTIAFTTQSSRDGSRPKLLKSLKLIRDLVAKHPEDVFIIQGTHRPVLTSGKIRESYYENWVPALITGDAL